jgi:hypothetical protein
VRSFRLFLLDDAGRVKDQHSFKASNEVAARQMAEEMRGCERAELWGTHHRVAIWRNGARGKAVRTHMIVANPKA